MSIAVQKSYSIHAHKAFSDPTRVPMQQPKSYGSTEDNAALKAWWEEALVFWNAFQRGEATATPAEIQSLEEQMEWAQTKLKGSNWGEGIGDWNPGEAADPNLGPHGNRIFNQASSEILFDGQQEGVYDVYSIDTEILVNSASARVEINWVDDTRVEPPAKVAQVKIIDDATGKTLVINVHDTDQLEDLIIKAPKPEKVVNNTDLDIQITKYTGENDVEQDQGVDPTEILGDNEYLYEVPWGTAGEFFFKGGVENEFHWVYGDAAINLLPSDEVDVYEGNPENSDGYTMVITHRDGTKDTVYVAGDPFTNYINGNPNKIRWHTKVGGGSRGNDGAPGDITGPNADGGPKMFGIDGDLTSGEDVGPGGDSGGGVHTGFDIPEGFKDFFVVNGGEDGSSTGEVPEAVQTLAIAMGLEDPTEIPEYAWDWITNPTVPPSADLVALLSYYDPQLRANIESLKNNPESELAKKAVRDRLASLLGEVFGFEAVDVTGAEGEDLSDTLYLHGEPLTIQLTTGNGPEGSFDAVKLVEGEGVGGAGNGDDEVEIPDGIRSIAARMLFDEDESKIDLVTKEWSELTKAQQDEILEKAQELIDSAQADLGIDLLDPPAWPSAEFIRWLASKDERTMDHLNDLAGAPEGEAKWAIAQQLQGDIEMLLNSIYGSGKAQTHGSAADEEEGWYDKVLFGGINFDMFDNEYEGGDPLGYIQWEETDWEA